MMNAQKNLLTEFGEAIDRYRASKQTVETNQPSPAPRIARGISWFLPNGGTVLLILMLILTQQIWARPLYQSLNVTSVSTIPYQGRLAAASGNPITGKQNMEFRIYNVPTDSTPLWEEFWTGANSVDVSDGLFSVMLGSINTGLAAAVQGNTTLYLGM